MPLNSPYWESLKKSIDSVNRKNLMIGVLVTFVFPIAEGILINLWTSSESTLKSPAFWSFLVFAPTHIIFNDPGHG